MTEKRELSGNIKVCQTCPPKPISWLDWLLSMLWIGFLDWLCIIAIIGPAVMLLRYLAIKW